MAGTPSSAATLRWRASLRRPAAVAAASAMALVAGSAAAVEAQGVPNAASLFEALSGADGRRLQALYTSPMTLDLRGDLTTTMHWYTDISLGVPSQLLPVRVDTTGGFLTIPCQETCGHRCSPYEHSQFIIANATAVSVVPSTQCPSFTKPSQSSCVWSGDFAEFSTATAILTEGAVFGREDAKVKFGCYVETHGDLLEATVSGVIGLASSLPGFGGSSTPGFGRQLVDMFPNKAFSMWIKDRGGALVLGAESVPDGPGVARFAMDIDDAGRYILAPLGVELVGKVPLKGTAEELGGRAVVNSAASYTRFPKALAKRITTAVDAACSTSPRCQRVTDPKGCFMVKNIPNPATLMPVFRFTFAAPGGGSTTLDWKPDDYLVVESQALWCMGVEENEDADELVLGASWLINKKVTFNIDPKALSLTVQKVDEDGIPIIQEAAASGNPVGVAFGLSSRNMIIIGLLAVAVVLAVISCRLLATPQQPMPYAYQQDYMLPQSQMQQMQHMQQPGGFYQHQQFVSSPQYGNRQQDYPLTSGCLC